MIWLRKAIVFWLAMAVFAVYNSRAIAGETSGIIWHVSQYISVALLVLYGILTGRRLPRDWHEFGELAGLTVIGIPVYVFLLHWIG